MTPDDDAALGSTTEEFNGDTTYYPEAPQETKDLIAEEQSSKSASYPIMGQIVEWFDDQIDTTNSIEQALITLEQYNDALAKGKPRATIDDVLVAHDIVRFLLSNKRDEYKEYKFETN